MIVGELLPQNLAISAPLPTAQGRRRPAAGVHPRDPAADHGAQRQRERGPAGRRRRAAGGALRRPHAGGARGPGAPLGRGRARSTRPTAELITRSLDFADRTAADVMTPRVRMQRRSPRRDRRRRRRMARRTGLQPVPGDRGRPRRHRRRRPPQDARSRCRGTGATRSRSTALMADAVRVPETVRLDPLLVELARAGAADGGRRRRVRRHRGRGHAGGRRRGDRRRGRRRARPQPRRHRAAAATASSSSRACCGPTRCGHGPTSPCPTARPTRPSAARMAVLGRVPAVGDEVASPGRGRSRVERMDGRRVDRVRSPTAGPPARRSRQTRPARTVGR